MRPDPQGTQQLSKDVLWEDLLDYSEIEAEEDFLQQHIALLVSNHSIGPCPLLLQASCIEISSAFAVLTVDNICTSCLSVVQNGTWVHSMASPYHPGVACADGPKYAVRVFGGPVCTRQ